MPTMRYLTDLADERETLAATLQTIVDAAATETRALTDTEQSQTDEIAKRIAIIDGNIESLVRTNESHERFSDLMRRASHRQDEQDTTDMNPGEMFVRSAANLEYSGRGRSSQINLDTRALIKTDTLAEPVPGGGKVYSLADRFPLFDRVNKVMVSGGTVEYIVDVAAPAAAIVDEGDTKPELVYTPNKKTGVLETVAHHAKFTRQFWEDEQGAFAAMLTSKGRAGVVKKMQAEVAATIAATTGTTVEHPDGLLQAVRVGIAQVEDNGGQASFLVVNPLDAAAFDIELYGSTLNGPTRGNTPWGLPIVANSGAPYGTAYVVDSDAVDLYMRNQVAMYMTDSDISGDGATATSDFRHNILTAIWETRALAVIGQPHLVLPCTSPAAP